MTAEERAAVQACLDTGIISKFSSSRFSWTMLFRFGLCRPRLGLASARLGLLSEPILNRQDNKPSTRTTKSADNCLGQQSA